MGVMSFLLPDGLAAEARRELERSSVAGGPDNMPTPTELTFANGQMRTRRLMDESGYLVAPWPVKGVGQVMGATATLMERSRPYALLIELARGKVNQMRSKAADWRMGGLQISAEMNQVLRQATLAFGQAATAATGGRPSAEEMRRPRTPSPLAIAPPSNWSAATSNRSSTSAISAAPNWRRPLAAGLYPPRASCRRRPTARPSLSRPPSTPCPSRSPGATSKRRRALTTGSPTTTCSTGPWDNSCR